MPSSVPERSEEPADVQPSLTGFADAEYGVIIDCAPNSYSTTNDGGSTDPKVTELFLNSRHRSVSGGPCTETALAATAAAARDWVAERCLC